VSNRYTEEMQVMGKPDDVYGKGALVLHMLRMRLGDEAFFAATREYLNRYKFKHATSDDFRRVLEDVSGQNLDRFFTQWTLRPGLPRLGVSYEYDDQSKVLKIGVEQTQRIDADNPAYAFSLPFYVRYPSGGGEYLYIDTDVRSTEATFEIKERPSGIRVDPQLTVAAPHTVTKRWSSRARIDSKSASSAPSDSARTTTTARI
jgi:aminopeptidase N